MDITISIPNELVNDIVEAICLHYRYDEKADEGETKPQFARRMIRQHLRDMYKDYKLKVYKDEKVIEIATEENDLSAVSDGESDEIGVS